MATLTVFPDPDPETDSIDGDIDSRQPLWSNARLFGSSKLDDFATIACKSQEVVGDAEYRVQRIFTTFDTSALGVGATIDAVVISLKGNGPSENSPTIHCVENSQVGDNVLAVDDFNLVGTISFANVSSWSDTLYNDFTLSAAGESEVSLTGITKYAFREAHDFDNSAPANDTQFRVSANAADTSGTLSDPKLVITYTPLPVADTSPSRRLGFGLGLDV